MTTAVRATFKPGEPIVFRPELGAEATFYRWKPWALSKHILVKSKGKLYMPKGCIVTEAA